MFQLLALIGLLFIILAKLITVSWEASENDCQQERMAKKLAFAVLVVGALSVGTWLNEMDTSYETLEGMSYRNTNHFVNLRLK